MKPTGAERQRQAVRRQSEREQTSQSPTSSYPETFPIRVAWKSVMISPRAKPGSQPRARGTFAVVDQIFFDAPRLTFSLFWCALVHPVQAACRRMVGQRTIQLWVVRSFFLPLSFLASLARPAASGNPKSQIPNPKFSSTSIRDSGASLIAADPSL